MMIKNQNFGIEIELTGITRQNAAKVIANYFGTTSRYIGTYYKVYGSTDRKGRTWKAMSDGSIRCQVKHNGRIESAGSDYSCEIVSPILQYEDIGDLQNIVRELVKAGAMANTSCSIHVHVDGSNHTPESLTRLLNFATGRQDLFYEALQIGDRENRWCHKISPELFKAMKAAGKESKEAAERIWYSSVNDGYDGIIPEGFDIITLPEAQYLMFQGEPFAEEDYGEAIEAVQQSMGKYDPRVIGYQWDDANPRIQLEPKGERGYIELRAIKAL